MANFPTVGTGQGQISCLPDANGWEEGPAYDPTIKSQMEGGYVVTQTRFTRVPKRWKLPYPTLTLADKAVLQAFAVSVAHTADIFQWVNPTDNETYSVRFAAALQFSPVKTGATWRTEVELVEA